MLKDCEMLSCFLQNKKVQDTDKMKTVTKRTRVGRVTQKGALTESVYGNQLVVFQVIIGLGWRITLKPRIKTFY